MRSRFRAFSRVCRRLLRTPLFTAVAVATLAIGIGANTAIFSVVYGVLLKPLPFHEADRLVALWHTAPGIELDLLSQSPASYLTYRESGRVFEDIGLWTIGRSTVTGRGEPERIESLYATDGLLGVLRVQPQLGRFFTRADDQPGAPLRTILTHGYWQRAFGGARDIVGRTITLDGKTVEIIGVLPESFRFLDTTPAIVQPMQIDRAKIFIGNFSYQAVARIKPGVTVPQVDADVARMIPFLLERFKLPPGFTRKMLDEARIGPRTRPLAADVIGDVSAMLWVLLGTVGIVLLIACANVANLFLVRAEGRQQELALRAALGASRGRIARELLTESVVLGLAGGAIGLLLARAGLALLAYLAPTGLPRLREIGLDPMVLLFTLLISIGAGLLFGLIPVLRFGEPSIAALKEGGRSTSDAPGRHRARSVLVVSEIALALVLLIASGLMVRTFVALRQVDPGFTQPEQVQTFRVSIPEALVPDGEQVTRTHQQIAERLRQVPGVTAVGLTTAITMDGNSSFDPVFVEDHPDSSGRMPPLRRYKYIAPGYFSTMGQRMVVGRDFTWDDHYRYAPVVIVSVGFAREYWKTPAEALGKRVRETTTGAWRQIVGVVGEERADGVHKPAPAITYWPVLVKDLYGEKVNTQNTLGYVVRSPRTNTPGFLRELQAAVWAINPNLPLANVRTLEEIRTRSMAQTSFALTMLGIAAGVALLLGIVGIYGVIAYVAAQRTREIGIRMALGADAADVRRLFLQHGLWLTAIGVAIGVAASLGLTRFVSSMLFEVSALDPVTYVAVSLLLGAVALLATWLPARRAARIDPISALRTDV